MTTTVVAILILVAIVLLLLALFARPQWRRRRLQRRFGPEYERMLRAGEDRRRVEQELADRQRRHAGLNIRALPADARARYADRWFEVQERFVDEPVAAVRAADELIVALMAERGYPTDGYQQQLVDLSVEHAHQLDSYRTAREVSSLAAANRASTEDLRQAMVRYRSLFEDLLGDRVSVGAGRRD